LFLKKNAPKHPCVNHFSPLSHTSELAIVIGHLWGLLARTGLELPWILVQAGEPHKDSYNYMPKLQVIALNPNPTFDSLLFSLSPRLLFALFSLHLFKLYKNIIRICYFFVQIKCQKIFTVEIILRKNKHDLK